MAFSQISTSVTIINTGLIGYNGISLTEFSTSAISAIASGSGIEIAGAFFKADSDVAINASSWTVITTGVNAYVYLTPSGTAGSQIITASWEATVPTWSTSKQGWYASTASNVRTVGRVTKVSATQQSNKLLMNKEDLILQQRADIGGNTAIGSGALNQLTIGQYNTAIGYGALSANEGSSNCIAIGYQALLNNSAASDNIAIGSNSLKVTTGQGTDNIAIGSNALINNIEGADNIAISSNALYSNENGNYNIAIGISSLQNNTSDENIAIGVGSLYTNITGYRNIAMGKNALYGNNSGNNNIAIGYSTGSSNVTGYNNVAIGSGALGANTTYNNTAVGYQALLNTNNGEANTAIGYAAGSDNVSGTGNIFVGFGSGNGASNISNIINLGGINITTLRCQVTTITALSDERDKKNIKDISLGLDFVNKLRPVEFDWDMREWYAKKDENGIAIKNDENDYIYDTPPDGSKIGKKDYNFIAQELLILQKENPWLQIVNTDNPNKLETTPGKMFPILVKAIQQLNDKVKSLEERI